jgi:hypothetical protein
MTDSNFTILQHVFKKADYTFKHDLIKPDIYKVCWKSLDKHYKLITFDYKLAQEKLASTGLLLLS